MTTTDTNINSANYRSTYRPRPRTCDICHEVPATKHVWLRAENGDIVTADVCDYCRDRGGWKGGR